MLADREYGKHLSFCERQSQKGCWLIDKQRKIFSSLPSSSFPSTSAFCRPQFAKGVLTGLRPSHVNQLMPVIHMWCLAEKYRVITDVSAEHHTRDVSTRRMVNMGYKTIRTPMPMHIDEDIDRARNALRVSNSIRFGSEEGPGPQQALRRSTRSRVKTSKFGSLESNTEHQIQCATREAEAHASLVYIGKDSHGGLGVFARKMIEPHEVALYYRGELFESQREHARAFPNGSTYALATKYETVWDATSVLCITRFVNHGKADQINAVLEGIQDTNVVQLILQRTIRKGEEIVIGYGDSYDYSLLTRSQQVGTDDTRLTPQDISQWLRAVGLCEPESHSHSKYGPICSSVNILGTVITASGSTTDELSEYSTLEGLSQEVATPVVGYFEGSITRAAEPSWSCKTIPTQHVDQCTIQSPLMTSKLVAEDGLVLRDGEYVTDWSRVRQQMAKVVEIEDATYLLPFLQDEGLEHNALARDTPESARIMPSTTNEAPWIQKAADAEWAWGTNIVWIDFVENSGVYGHQQVWLDTIMRPFDAFHFRTRSGRAGVNRKIMGAFVVVETKLEKEDSQFVEPPLIQVDHKHGVRVAGNIIPGVWQDQHNFEWKDIPVQLIHPRYASGGICMDAEGRGGTGWAQGHAGLMTSEKVQAKRRKLQSHSGTRQSEHVSRVIWELIRTRVVGGPGGIPVYSPKRKIEARIESAATLPYPSTVANREEYSVPLPRPPKTQRQRAVFADWEEVFRSGRYTRVQAWIKRHSIHISACEKYASEHKLRFIPDEAYAKLAKTYRLPTTLLMDDSDLVEKCRGMRICRCTDGTLKEMFDDDGPLIPGTIKPGEVLRDHIESTPWANARLFQNLHEGYLSPKAHGRGNTIVLRPYPKKLYQGAAIWKEEREKGLSPEPMATMFYPAPLAMELTCIPIIIASRSHVEKEVANEYRQIVNMSLDVEHGVRKVGPSLNVRLRAARELEPPIPNLELVKGSDVATTCAIFRAFGLRPKVYTWDASAFFHSFAVAFMQSTEAGILGPDGMGVSTVLDMGREDSPRLTAQVSAYLAETVSKEIHKQIYELVRLVIRIANGSKSKPTVASWPALEVCIKAQHMVRVRERRFGKGTRQARLSPAYMYVDDKALVTIEGCDDLIENITIPKCRRMGIYFKPEKNGENVFIGQQYVLNPGAGFNPSQHIKKKKIRKYLDDWAEVVQLKTISHNRLDQLTGRLTYAATACLELKGVAALVNDCVQRPRNVTSNKRKAWCTQGDQGGQGNFFDFPAKARNAVQYAMEELERDEGLPLLPRFELPRRGELSTICIWSDACLNEDDGYNGFGIWFLIPREGQKPEIFALFDVWSKEEEQHLGHNVPLAEGVCFPLALRAVAAARMAKTIHDATLHFSDSEGGSLKFGSLKTGSIPLDNTRTCWQKLQDCNAHVPPTWIVFTPREFNTGSDCLSKGRYELFCATLKAAGLGNPTRIYLSSEDRNIMDLITAKERVL